MQNIQTETIELDNWDGHLDIHSNNHLESLEMRVFLRNVGMGDLNDSKARHGQAQILREIADQLAPESDIAIMSNFRALVGRATKDELLNLRETAMRFRNNFEIAPTYRQEWMDVARLLTRQIGRFG